MSNSTNLRADLQLAGQWTNITGDVYTAEQVAIKRGRSDESASPEAASLDITLNNRSGKYTPSNPSGAYYGMLGRQTPIRLGMGTPPAGNGAYGPSSTTLSAPSVVAETSGYAFSYWAIQATADVISGPAGYSMGTQQTGLFSTGRGGVQAFTAGTVPVATATAASAATWAAATVFLPAGTGSISSVQVGAGSGNTGSFDGTVNSIVYTPVSLNQGDVLLVAQAWSGDISNSMTVAPQDNSGGCSWVLVADSGFNIGATSPRVLMWAFYSDSVQTVTVTVPSHYYYVDDNLSQMWVVTGVLEWNSRFAGQCATFNSTADLSGNDVRCALEAGSVLRQRGQGAEAPRSFYYRYFSKSKAAGYWPLENATGDAITSPLPGVSQAIMNGSATYNSQALPGSDSVVTMAAGTYVQCPIVSYNPGTAAAAAMSCVFQVGGVPSAATNILSAYLSAPNSATAVQLIRLQWDSATQVQVNVFSGSGTSVVLLALGNFLPAGVTTLVGRPLFIEVCWAPNVANPTTQTDFTAFIGDLTSGAEVFYGVTTVTCTTGEVLDVFGGSLDQPLSIGHIGFVGTGRIDHSNIFSNPMIQTNAGLSLLASAGANEGAVPRMTRICQEQSINFQSRAPASKAAPVLMGAQLTNDTISLLEECQETDGEGELFEARGFPGLAYRSIDEISGGASQATLDFAAKQITAPFNQVDDDQLTRNYVTVQQVGGASQLVFQATGALNINPPPVGVGLFTGNPTVNVYDQSRDLPQLGSWFVHVGTTQAPRYPAVTSQLAASPTTVSATSSLDCGQRFTIVNPPAWCPPGPIEMVALGFTETISAVPGSSWDVTVNARPYAPFQVMRLGGTSTATSILDSGSSTLTSNISSSATSLSVTTSLKGDLWTGTVPFDINIDGERMTVTAVSGTSSPQTFTVTRAVNGVAKAHTAGAAIDVFFQQFAGL